MQVHHFKKNEKLDENEFRREIFRTITGKCLQDLSVSFKQNREVCKVFMSNISLISLFFHPILKFKVIIRLTFVCWTSDTAGMS